MGDLILGLKNFIIDPASRAILAVAGTVIAGGMVFYHYVEDLTWIDSFYFCAITLTTVGFGDITPTTTEGKLFTVAYAIVGIGIFVALVSTVAHHLIEAKKLRKG